MLLRVAFRTLGCKLNQLESESIADSFRAAGAAIVPYEVRAELYVLNTCTVTGKAEQKARRLVRAALAANPAAVVLVTGCYAEMDPAGIAALGERALVLPGGEKSAVLSLAGWLSETWQGHGELRDAVLEWLRGPAAGASPEPFAFLPEVFSFHSRPSLKIQDGCDNRCTYCRVCLARGSSVSLPAPLVLERLRSLEAAGRAEVVLTGVNLSQYRDGELGFAGLLRYLLRGTERVALRISSFEPDRVDEAFLEAFAEPRVRPHLHLPVQSGSDPVLARMGRAYRAEAVLRACERARALRDDPFLACDLIAGFPGEGEADFSASLELARACGFAGIHAFPYSPRPGTRAEAFRPRVPERLAGERVEALNALAAAARAAYVERWLGREVDAVLEADAGGACEDEGHDEAAPTGAPLMREQARRATTENYLRVGLEEAPDSLGPGAAFRCRLERRVDPARALGSVDARARPSRPGSRT